MLFTSDIYINPADLGMYYLDSRYFDPVIRRFINADNAVAGDRVSVQGYNLYSYCFNNPVNMDDKDGKTFWICIRMIVEE